MSGFLNNDGSELVGALNPGGTGQALQVDGSGNLKVNATITPAAQQNVNLDQVNGTALSSGNPVPISGSITLADPTTPTQKMAVDASGRIDIADRSGRLVGHVTVDTLPSLPTGANTIGNVGLVAGSALIGVVQLADGTTTTQKLAVDASGRLTLVPNQTIKVVDSGGSNQLAIDASGRLTLVPNQTINVAQWNGSAPGLTNPVIMEDQIRAWTVNGQSFSATTNKQTSAGAINAGFSIFNPVASGKTLILFSLKYTIGNNSFNTLNLTTTDPAYGTSITPVNNKAGSGTTSIASATFTNTNVTGAGTVNDAVGSASNTQAQVLQNGDILVVPSGNGFAFYLNLSGANSWVCSAEWIEM